MIPLDDLKKWLEKIDDESTLNVFTEHEKNLFKEIPKSRRPDLLKELFAKPADLNMITSWYFWNKWVEVLLTIKKPMPVRLLELASGSNVGIPRALSVAYNHLETSYVTANTNKELTKEFREGTKDLPIRIDIIEDDAKRIEDYAENGAFDIIAFEHSVNDIIYDMLAQKNGLDTINTPWFDIHQDMINFTNEEFENGTLEASAKDKLLDIFSSCINVLKKDSFIIINHFMYQYDLDRGINYDFWENLLPIVRKWIKDAGLGQEVFFDGFEPQWWMFIKKL